MGMVRGKLGEEFWEPGARIEDRLSQLFFRELKQWVFGKLYIFLPYSGLYRFWKVAVTVFLQFNLEKLKFA